jgi:hypothetical protein
MNIIKQLFILFLSTFLIYAISMQGNAFASQTQSASNLSVGLKQKTGLIYKEIGILKPYSVSNVSELLNLIKNYTVFLNKIKKESSDKTLLSSVNINMKKILKIRNGFKKDQKTIENWCNENLKNHPKGMSPALQKKWNAVCSFGGGNYFGPAIPGCG